MSVHVHARAFSMIVLSFGCGETPIAPRDAGERDAAPPKDAGASTSDASTSDSGSRDASTPRDSATAPGVDGGDPLLGLPTCEVLAELTIDALQAPARASDGYRPASSQELVAFGRSVRALAREEVGPALDWASEAEYELCRGTGDERDLVLYAPADRTSGRARVVVRTREASRLAVEVPHPMFDSETLPEGVLVFQQANARALIVAGTHRCASSELGCAGSGAACGDHRISDAAHYTQSIFHRAHVELSAIFSEDVFVSLHGYRQDGLRLSNGTDDPAEPASRLGRLARALVDEGVEGVTACNAGLGVPVRDDYCGTSNVQGRHSNGSPDACAERADAASDRFIHMEQSADVRADRALVARAFASAFSD